MSLRCGLVLVAVVLGPTAASAAPFKYPEGKHGKGELKYVNGLPVLIVEGSPEEIGTQIGTLALKPASKVVASLKRFVKELGLEKSWPILVRAGKGLFKSFPEAYRKEAEAMAKASGIDLDLIVLANTITDLQKIAGCSTLTVGAERSATGAPLFGRNWDFAPLGNLHEYSLVIVYRPTGKRAFAVVGFPGLLMGGSAINDAGLAVAANEVSEAADDSARFNPRGVATVVGLRRLMEECATAEEAEKLVRSVKPTCMANLIVCDKKGAAVFEVTTKTVMVRRPVDGLCVCTNHFRSKPLATSTRCHRFDALEKKRSLKKLALADVAKGLHAANQGAATMQTMVFEPASLKLHLALAKGPASAQPLKVLELAPLLERRAGGGSPGERHR